MRPNNGESGYHWINTGSNRLPVLILFAIATLCCCLPTRAEQPFADKLLVFGAAPKKTIEHAVEWKGPVDSSRRETMLTGPTHYAAIIDRDLPSRAQRGVFNWYRIKDPSKTVATRAKVWIDDDAPYGFQFGAPVYFLSTMQRISEGPPTQVHDGGSHFVAYRILDADKGHGELTPFADAEARHVAIRRAAFFCLPVEEWHHHEHFPVKNSKACLVVYEIESIESEGKGITALDQFGLHSLQLQTAKMLCIPGKRFQLEKDGR